MITSFVLESVQPKWIEFASMVIFWVAYFILFGGGGVQKQFSLSYPIQAIFAWVQAFEMWKLPCIILRLGLSVQQVVFCKAFSLVKFRYGA